MPYNGCILADSVGLGKTFTALGVVKYYELRNRSVLVLCPKRLADNWLNYNRNLKTNIFAKDRFNYDVLCHTDLLRDTGESFGTRLDLVNWGNYDLVVIDESNNFRNNDAFKDRETRESDALNQKLKTGRNIEEIFRRAQAAFNGWSKLPNERRTAEAILSALDFDFFELLDTVTIARSRKKTQAFYGADDVGRFPDRLILLSQIMGQKFFVDSRGWLAW